MTNAKTAKLAKEVQSAGIFGVLLLILTSPDHGYRLGILRLEEVRQKLIKARERAFKVSLI